ncbi:Protein CBG12823 [Caenorhabditis briggsae]|uniref:Protein CBG12823 n=1 Tax=Caenorhabditis briggsae TaxID=6238 RepID=A8XFP8_CAEBR|nr:Protein CBG12823 [Caenorhabditis briggsae]CAP31744.2 Protein CBG12823 [Caenorhabditis briggsae]
MQAWEYRETDSPLSSDVTLHSLKPVETDSAMSIASDFDETFWDQELNRGRSQSFGGTTQYSQQFMQRKIIGRPFFKTSLETVDSGTNRYLKDRETRQKCVPTLKVCL